MKKLDQEGRRMYKQEVEVGLKGRPIARQWPLICVSCPKENSSKVANTEPAVVHRLGARLQILVSAS